MSKDNLPDHPSMNEWTHLIGNSFFRVRVRFVGRRDKLVADVWEYSRHRTSKARALHLAREHVSPYGIASADNTLLFDHEIEKKVSDKLGEKVLIRIRQTSFVFQGVSQEESFLKI